MRKHIAPVVNQWYVDNSGDIFRVVAYDAAAGLVEIQDFDGDITELDLDSWKELEIERTSEPEDWSGPFDEIDPEDMGYSETAMQPRDWRKSIESARNAPERWEDTRTAIDFNDAESDRLADLYAQQLEDESK